MKRSINEHLVKISAGYIVIADELAIDEDVTLIIQGAVTKVEDRSNQDGTVNRIYTVKGVIAEAIRDGESIGQKGQGRKADEVQQESAERSSRIPRRLPAKR